MSLVNFKVTEDNFHARAEPSTDQFVDFTDTLRRRISRHVARHLVHRRRSPLRRLRRCAPATACTPPMSKACRGSAFPSFNSMASEQRQHRDRLAPLLARRRRMEDANTTSRNRSA